VGADWAEFHDTEPLIMRERLDGVIDRLRPLDRRALLRLLAGVAFSAARPVSGAARQRITIAGGGIIGANLAYRLARRGAEVTLLERTRPGSGATANSFAWINATYSKQPYAYFHLNRLGIEAWQQLDRELPGELPLRWGGSVEWYGDEANAKRFREEIQHHQAWGYPAHMIAEPELRALEPHIEPGQVAASAHAEIEGSVDPVAVTEAMIKRAGRAGAKVTYPADVTGLDERGGRLQAVRTTAGDVATDVLVIACGTDTPRIAAMAGVRVPLKDSPGILVHTTPQPRLVERVVLSPIAHMKQKPDGRIVTGSGFGGSPSTDTSRDAAERFLRTASRVLPAFAKADVEKVTLGWRPLPQDEFPVIGFPSRRRDVYIAVMHSGVTLSPLVAQLAAMEILDGVAVEPLAPYRPARFEK
jgi:glycine/D-amino acid oxidase-like deaminating enzyme